MRRTTSVAGLAAVAVGVLGLTWFALYLGQPMLGFEDTDDPALGVRFVRAHPDVFTGTGIALILMSILLTIAVVSLAATAREGREGRERGDWAVRATSAFGLFAAFSFLVFGVMRIGAVGPLLHIASLDAAWGETAYLVVQMAGVQGLLPAGLLALGVWATGLSLIGLRTRLIPLAMCILGLIPAIHVAGRLVGELDVLPEEAWLLMIASIPGTLVWCVLLGLGLTVRALRMSGTAGSDDIASVEGPAALAAAGAD
jgi:hypothetical protein